MNVFISKRNQCAISGYWSKFGLWLREFAEGLALLYLYLKSQLLCHCMILLLRRSNLSVFVDSYGGIRNSQTQWLSTFQIEITHWHRENEGLITLLRAKQRVYAKGFYDY